MDLSSTITDNVTDVLEKIIEFTRRRNNVLARNILDINEPDFIPKDLDVPGFADLMGDAVSEHIRSRRLLLCDNNNIKFGSGGDFKSLPVIDKQAGNLLCENVKAYLRLQMEKLSENTLNNKVANQLLKHKQTANPALNS